jgi:hypothetical protein
MKASNFAGLKHGAVMPITMEGMQRLKNHFAR